MCPWELSKSLVVLDPFGQEDLTAPKGCRRNLTRQVQRPLEKSGAMCTVLISTAGRFTQDYPKKMENWVTRSEEM